MGNELGGMFGGLTDEIRHEVLLEVDATYFPLWAHEWGRWGDPPAGGAHG